MTYETREEWLLAAAERLNEMIAEKTDLKPSSRFQIACGWPRRDRGGKVVGQCFTKSASRGVHHVFISPTMSDRVMILDTVLHELVHAADDCKSQHKGAFVRAIRALGMEGKPTSTHPGKELRKTFQALAKELGPYPHSALNPTKIDKPQSTRMLKVVCAEGSDYCVRMTRKWIEEVGYPKCGCHGIVMMEVTP